MKNQIIKIALSGVLIYLISRKLYRILSQLLFWYGIEFEVNNKTVHLALYIIICSLVLLLLFGLYNIFLESKVPTIKTIVILLSITILLSLTTALGNYLLGVLGVRFTEYLSIYSSLHSLEHLFIKVYSLFALVFFLWKLYLGEKQIKTKNS